MYNFKSISPGIFHKKMLPSIRTRRRIRLNIDTTLAEKIKSGLHIRGFDLADTNAEIAQLRLKGRRDRGPARVLPDLHSSTPKHIERKNGVSGLWLATGIWEHETRFSRFFKNGHIHAEMLAIPFERFVDVAYADANLLNS